MNFYLIEKNSAAKPGELFSAIKQFLKEKLFGTEDPVLKLACGGDNSFFLKTPVGIIWVRIFEQDLTSESFSALYQDIERVKQMFRQEVRFCLFAPGFGQAVSADAELPGDLLLFEYYFLQSRFGQAAAFKERKREPSLKTPIKDEFKRAEDAPAPVLPGKSFKTVRLEREELSELINLSLELKGLSQAPSAVF